MSQPIVAPDERAIAVYDRHAAYELLRTGTPQRLRDELQAGRFGSRLEPSATAELEALLTAWVQRALGPVTLRDALLVDEQRGRRVFALICAELTVTCVTVPAALSARLPTAPCDLAALPPELSATPALADLAQRAAAEGLSLAVLANDGLYPFPTDLAALVPVAPVVPKDGVPRFAPPTGWRRWFAILLVAAGVALLGLPLLFGRVPEHPAGWPLALLTLSLLVGIRAGWRGLTGGLCLWLVANLPGFRYDSPLLTILWPALPIVGLGLVLLSFDRQVRSLWRWVRRQR